MVEPDRDTPGISAAACPKPIAIASRMVVLSSLRSCLLSFSAASRTSPSAISVEPIR